MSVYLWKCAWFTCLFYKFTVWQLFYTLLTDAAESSLVLLIYPVNANNLPWNSRQRTHIVDQFKLLFKVTTMHDFEQFWFCVRLDFFCVSWLLFRFVRLNVANEHLEFGSVKFNVECDGKWLTLPIQLIWIARHCNKVTRESHFTTSRATPNHI